VPEVFQKDEEWLAPLVIEKTGIIVAGVFALTPHQLGKWKVQTVVNTVGEHPREYIFPAGGACPGFRDAGAERLRRDRLLSLG
jgi:hypothetical protein